MAFSDVLYLARPLAKLVRTSDVFGGTGMRTYIERGGHSTAEALKMKAASVTTEGLICAPSSVPIQPNPPPPPHNCRRAVALQDRRLFRVTKGHSGSQLCHVSTLADYAMEAKRTASASF